MNRFDSHLEALAFNYLSYGFFTAVNSIWPLVAVLTAAYSFWRIGAFSSSKLVPRDRSPDGASTSLSPFTMDEDVGAGASISTQFNTEHSSGSNTKCRALERQGSTKGKFTLYYSDKDECRTGEGGDNSGGAVAKEKFARWCDDWERMMVVKLGDMAWHRYQDVTVLDGSVVRLWDSRRRSNTTAVGGVTW